MISAEVMPMLPVELLITLVVGVIVAVALNSKKKKPAKPPTLEQQVQDLQKRVKQLEK